MKNVLITGGTGLVGMALSAKLMERGYKVSILSRKVWKNPSYEYFNWDISKRTIDIKGLQNQDYIVHLAGENLGAARWSPAQKQKIFDSRVKSSELLFEKIAKNNISIKAFISASAVGIYPAFSDGGPDYDETSEPGNGFVQHICQEWEKAADNFIQAGIRTVKVRTGLVQDKKDPALKKILQLAKFGILPVFGKGKQYFPWIHINDLVNVYVAAIENEKMEGPVNAVAPDLVTNLEYTKVIKSVRSKGLIFKIPAFVFKIMFGEMSEIILRGTKIKSKLHNYGFVFEFPKLDGAMRDLLG